MYYYEKFLDIYTNIKLVANINKIFGIAMKKSKYLSI